MATNKLFYAPQWKTVATVSTPETGFAKLYKKNSGSNWYTVNDQGIEKEIAISLLTKNGITYIPGSTTSVYAGEISLSLGLGLTFSQDAIGSSVSVFNVAPNMLYAPSPAVDGYILSSTSSGSSFNWIPFNSPGIEGTTNKIAKFGTTSSVTNSIMTDDGSRVIIGVTPTVLGVSFSNSGDQLIGGKLYLTDDQNTFIEYNSGILVRTNLHYRIQDENNYAYLNLMTDDNLSQATYTFSVLNNTILLSDKSGYRTFTANNLNVASFGTTSATMSFNIYATGSVLRVRDGSQGLNRVFVSDATGLGSWVSLTSDYINFRGNTNSISKFSGTGLTNSFLYEGVGTTASSSYLGFGASFSQNDLPLRPFHLKVNDGSNFTKLAIHNYNLTNGNSDSISFRTDTTASSFIEYAAIRAVYESHDDTTRTGRLEFLTRNSAISSTNSNTSMVLRSDGTVFIPGTQSGVSALQFGSMTSSSSPTGTSSVALTVDSSGRIILSNVSSVGYLDSPYDKGLTANTVTTNGGTASNSKITMTPVVGSYVSVFVNGQEIEVGNGTTNSSCYFGTHSSIPKGFSASNAITAGDNLYWNPSISGFNLESGWRISLHYLI